MRIVILSLLILALVPSCATNDVDSALQAARAKASIDSLWTRYALASDQRDAAAFAEIFTDDATIVFAGAPSVHGRRAIGDFLAARSKDIDATGLRVLPEELKAAGSLAAQGGTFERRFIEADSQKTEYGRYVLIAERGADKSWRIRRLMGVADSVR
jgi:uncharacterized protein (TIGR02246 family)